MVVFFFHCHSLVYLRDVHLIASTSKASHEEGPSLELGNFGCQICLVRTTC